MGWSAPHSSHRIGSDYRVPRVHRTHHGNDSVRDRASTETAPAQTIRAMQIQAFNGSAGGRR